MPSRFFIRRYPLLGALFALGACAPVGPDHEAPLVEMPASFSQGGVKWRRETPDTLPKPQAWWRLFGDSTLNLLVERALDRNQELAAAAARVREAREMSNMARSRYFPAVDMGITAERTKFRFRGPGGGSNLANNYTVPVDLSYEIDTWGKIRRQVESATASEQAAGELLNALRLTIAAETAQTYWALRAVDADRAVLSGSTASGSTMPEKTELPGPPSVPVSVPSSLLRQRPDIRAAERNVAAANAQIGVATAAFFPSITINASTGLDSSTYQDLFDARSLVWSLGASAITPLTNLRFLQAQRRATVAAHEAASAEYRQTVLEALREAESALQAAAILERRQTAQDQALAAARKTFDLSVKRFNQGLVSFLDVVDAERTRLDAERAANAIRAERLAMAVSLAKAVGGEW